VGERRNDLIGTQRENVVFLLFSGDGICLDSPRVVLGVDEILGNYSRQAQQSWLEFGLGLRRGFEFHFLEFWSLCYDFAPSGVAHSAAEQ
jgi:hypothetical protein